MDQPFIDVDLWSDLIADKGITVDWYRTQRCPCLNDNGDATFGCGICGGLSWMRAVPAQRIRGLLLSNDPKRQRHLAGEFDNGTRQFTPPVGIRLDEGDQLVLQQAPVRRSEVLVYGADVASQVDRLQALDVTQVLSVRAARQNLTVVHTFPAASYTDPTGVAVLPDGSLNWQTATVPVGDYPDPGEQISVEYMHLETYQVTREPMAMQRFAQDKRLPDKVTVRLVTRRLVRHA